MNIYDHVFIWYGLNKYGILFFHFLAIPIKRYYIDLLYYDCLNIYCFFIYELSEKLQIYNLDIINIFFIGSTEYVFIGTAFNHMVI